MTFSDLLFGLLGFALALVLVSGAGRWIQAMVELRRTGAGWTSLVAASAGSSAPWMLAIVAFGAYRLRAEAWLSPVAAGVAIGAAFVALLARRPPPQPGWEPGKPIKADASLRRIMWFGRNKGAWMFLHGMFFGLLLAVVFDYQADWQMPLLGDAIFFTMGYLVGLLYGWQMWHLFVWPIYAAYPGTTMSPPGKRVYEDDLK